MTPGVEALYALSAIVLVVCAVHAFRVRRRGRHRR